MSLRRLHLHPSHAPSGSHSQWARRVRAAAARLSSAQPRAARPDRAREAHETRPLALARSLWQRFDKDRSLGVAAEMAFWLFLSLLPLAAVAGLITAKFLVVNWSSAAPLLQSVPLSMRQMIITELGRVAAWNGGQVGIGTGLMFVWLASSGVHAIFDGIELASNAVPRPWWRKRLMALAGCLALSAGVAILALLATGLGWLWQLAGGAPLLQALRIEASPLGQIARLVLGAALSFGLVSGLYWLGLPPVVRRATPIVPGALLAMGLQLGLGLGYGFYLKQVGDSGAYLAGLASIGVTLVALYLFCVALLIGMEVNQMLGEPRRTGGLAVRRRRGPLSPRPRRRAASRPRRSASRRRGSPPLSAGESGRALV